MPQHRRSLHSLADAVIYRCIVGSRAYGLDTDGSDVDTRGIYLAPAERHWSLYGVPEQLEDEATDEVYWELHLQRVTLLVGANGSGKSNRCRAVRCWPRPRPARSAVRWSPKGGCRRC